MEICCLAYGRNKERKRLSNGFDDAKINNSDSFLTIQPCFFFQKLMNFYFQIHWFRNGEFLDHTAYTNNDRLRENKKHFSLEIRRVEVSDQVKF